MSKVRLALEDDHHTPLPPNEMVAEIHPVPLAKRDAINSLIDDIVETNCAEIAALRRTLDAVEQRVLERAAAAKHHLSDQAAIKDEIASMGRAIEDIRARLL